MCLKLQFEIAGSKPSTFDLISFEISRCIKYLMMTTNLITKLLVLIINFIIRAPSRENLNISQCTSHTIREYTIWYLGFNNPQMRVAVSPVYKPTNRVSTPYYMIDYHYTITIQTITRPEWLIWKNVTFGNYGLQFCLNFLKHDTITLMKSYKYNAMKQTQAIHGDQKQTHQYQIKLYTNISIIWPLPWYFIIIIISAVLYDYMTFAVLFDYTDYAFLSKAGEFTLRWTWNLFIELERPTNIIVCITT